MDELWQKMKDSEKNNFVMTAGTTGDVSNSDIEEVGLVRGDVYTVLKGCELNGERVVRVRNPWGSGEYNGDWSDKSRKWTTALKKQEGLNQKDDGDFYMSFNDFCQYYVTMGFAKVHPTYETTVCRVPKEKMTGCRFIKAKVTVNNTHCYFQSYQKNPRIILENGTYQHTVLTYLMLVDSK